ncbi:MULTISPECIES: amino acid ABC transporter permease [unclassified Aureimonas]|uniref:amino acid ABC transporter permease n=1 Tax=unclassified Aureimonas TaxID=2615206 RepID=UPI0006F63714|nr:MULTISPECIES: amino acid ABC transporter permease [unclassified Aureimonas]KQT57509.1 amino acid ABC transporter permease [Aureimonas sp. Leaf427]KQT77189.1 amino acid ABC transporter permease [Aureimonas sp. Leaf460]
MTAETHPLPRQGSKTAIFTNPTVRSAVVQVVLLGALVAFAWWIIDNTAANMRQANMASGFGFLGTRSSFEIGQHLIEYSSNSTYGRAILVGILNTLVIAISGIVLATILGFIVGIGRLSRNFLVRSLATVYVETFRNIPPLLVILFWYFGVLALLQAPRGLAESPIGVYLTNRGLQIPAVIFQPLAWVTLAALVVGIVATILLSRRNKAHQLATGERRSLLLPALGLIVGLPVVAFVATGLPGTLEFPAATRFNLVGGLQVRPEYIALFLALSIYTGAFIAEIVRAGILSVSKGQSEAAMALGLTRSQLLRLVVVPQAFRVIIPPLTSQYLNLTKNSSLGFAIGYPELYSIGSTVANQAGQTVEVVAIWICAYLGISLVSSFLMNMFNARMALVER